ncbi:MAG: hypothetical protein Q9225_003368 [Loekoesia sp. 1 TL-2023]
MVRSIERQYFSCISNVKSLYFEFQKPTVPASPSKASKATPLTQAIATASIADISISAKEIIQTLVAHKAKKQFRDVKIGETIKELAGGKSTLQNELLGDLGNEFGALPDGLEDTPIQTLSESLESNFSGQLGKQSSSILARLISSKMPAGFNLIGSSTSGDSTEDAKPLSCSAKEYFGSLTRQYAEVTGIVLQTESSGYGDQPSATALVDSAQLAALRKEQRDLASKQIKPLKNNLGNASDFSEEFDEAAVTQRSLQKRLDLWTAEFPEDFEFGIQPCFDIAKARRFDSSWNSVRECIVSLSSDDGYAIAEPDGSGADELMLYFANRSDHSTIGPGSTGAEVVRGLLRGDARVIVTTSRLPSTTASFYRQIFEGNGAQGSELLVLPCNQASTQDCQSLIEHIYSHDELHRNLDAIIPFAAVSQSGAEIDDLGARSELAHRMMLVNVLRLLGFIIKHKHQKQLDTRHTHVLIPLSPNTGIFGGDGLYSESKLGLESLLKRYHSESWSDYLGICGAIVGWTRGTGLMEGSNILAQEIESHGPVLADLNGGLQDLPDLKNLMLAARSKLNTIAEIRREIKNEDALEASILHGPKPMIRDASKPTFRSSLQVGYRELPSPEKILQPLEHLQGVVDLSSVVVIVGFSELGPWGSARTRWEIEHKGQLSQEGYIEMAWVMNLIRHFDGDLKGEHYVGWVDVKSGQRVQDDEIPELYSVHILKYAGLRFVEPELFGGYDPKRKEYLFEVAIEEDLPEFETTQASAGAFRLRHGDNVTIRSIPSSEQVMVQIKRGSHISLPKAIPFDGEVAGQIPTGWDPLEYGIPDDLIEQVDPVTLYTLCCVSEALYSAGIEDSLEVFKHIHLSELGNFIGSSFGGMKRTRQMYKDRYLDKEVQGGLIQEGFANSPAAWVNMLLLGAAGPIKTPVGVCATGVESLDSASESILCGKTRMCLVGGTDDFQEEPSFGFGSMKATVNSKDELSKGREPREMSRPIAETRAGFVESQGAGVQIIASAELAQEMGLPIYGIVASSAMATDKITHSLPAPGQGILSFSRATPAAASSPLMSLDFRREQMRECLSQNRQAYDGYTPRGCGSGAWTPYSSDSDGSKPQSKMPPLGNVDLASDASIAVTRRFWGNGFRHQDSTISPLAASLAVWGLNINDVDVVLLHGTSTKANDKKVSEVIHKQMTHLGRTRGQPALAIFQKSVTGHPKAPAAT